MNKELENIEKRLSENIENIAKRSNCWDFITEKKVRTIIDDTLTALQLNPYILYIEFVNDDVNKEVRTPAMVISPQYPYKNYVFYCYPVLLKMSDEQIRRIATHECIHIILQRMRAHRKCSDKIFTNAEEEVVEHLTFLLHKPDYE